MAGLSIHKGAMAPARACYCSPCVAIKVGGVSLERLCWQPELGVLLWLHHFLQPSLAVQAEPSVPLFKWGQ